MEPSIGVVIVNYNGERYQNECIRTIKKMNYSNYQIIVVDSHSSDDSIKKLQDEFPDVHVLLQTENVGIAKGNNIGIRYSKELGMQYTMLLNNDVELDDNMFSELIKYADENTITVPKIFFYEPQDRLWFAGGRLEWKIGSVVHRGWEEKDEGKYDKIEKITFATACCMLIHNSIFDKVGLMDEQVFMYFDDTDFCVRLGEQGYSILYVPSAKMWHKASSSTGGFGSKIQTYYMRRNQLYYMKKYKKYMKRFDVFIVCLKDMIRGVLSLVWVKNNRYIWIGYADFLRGRMGRRDF